MKKHYDKNICIEKSKVIVSTSCRGNVEKLVDVSLRKCRTPFNISHLLRRTKSSAWYIMEHENILRLSHKYALILFIINNVWFKSEHLDAHFGWQGALRSRLISCTMHMIYCRILKNVNNGNNWLEIMFYSNRDL